MDVRSFLLQHPPFDALEQDRLDRVAVSGGKLRVENDADADYYRAEIEPLFRDPLVEFVGGAMVAVGFQAGIAAFVCAGEMAVAYFIAHQPRALWPIVNKGELAVLYCWAFLLIATRGSGKLSIDRGWR